MMRDRKFLAGDIEVVKKTVESDAESSAAFQRILTHLFDAFASQTIPPRRESHNLKP
jgi:hypothetical protein